MNCITTALNGSFWKWVPEEGCIDAYRKNHPQGKEYAAISADDRMTSRNLWIDSGMLSDVRACTAAKPVSKNGGDELIPLCQSAGAQSQDRDFISQVGSSPA
jgi:hypothetical protein